MLCFLRDRTNPLLKIDIIINEYHDILEKKNFSDADLATFQRPKAFLEAD